MANYVATVESDRDAAEVFAYLADLRNFAEWDPGVIQVEQVKGSGGGAKAAFDVTVKAWPKPLTLRYETVLHDAPHMVRVVARTDRLVSDDTITVGPTDRGCVVTYDATLKLQGWLGAADPAVGIVFDRIAGRAADGLRDQLSPNGRAA